MTNSDRLIRLKKAAEMLGVHPETLRRWDRAGKLKAVVINDRGDRRYRQSEIENLINNQDITK